MNSSKIDNSHNKLKENTPSHNSDELRPDNASLDQSPPYTSILDSSSPYDSPLDSSPPDNTHHTHTLVDKVKEHEKCKQLLVELRELKTIVKNHNSNIRVTEESHGKSLWRKKGLIGEEE